MGKKRPGLYRKGRGTPINFLGDQHEMSQDLPSRENAGRVPRIWRKRARKKKT